MGDKIMGNKTTPNTKKIILFIIIIDSHHKKNRKLELFMIPAKDNIIRYIINELYYSLI